MRTRLGFLLTAALLAVSLGVAGAQPAVAAATDPAPAPCPSVDPNALNPGVSQECIDQAKLRQQALKDIQDSLGSTLAEGLAAQQQLSESILLDEKQQRQLKARIRANVATERRLDAEAVRLDAEIAATSKRVDQERRRVRFLARVIYTQPSSQLVQLAQAQSLGDLITQLSDLVAAGARVDEIKRSLDADLQRISADRAKVAADRTQAAVEHAQMVSGLAKLQTLHDQEMASAADLQAKLDQTRGELKSAGKQSTELAKQIAQMLQEQEEAIIASAMQQVWDQYEAWQKANPAPVTGTPSVGHSKQFRFIWPEPKAKITQPFGPSQFWFEPPFNGHPHFHTGIDEADVSGTHVLAADDGVVALVGKGTTGYGNYVVIAHQGGFTTLYGHLEGAVVHQGDHVTQGQVIGFEGSTGNSTGPHLHFELRIDGTPQDPSPYLPPGPSDFKG